MQSGQVARDVKKIAYPASDPARAAEFTAFPAIVWGFLGGHAAETAW